MKWKLFLLLIALTLSAGCKKESPSAEERLAFYMNAWQNNGYETMYSLLSAQSKDKLAQDAFVERHKAIFEGIEAASPEMRLLPAEAPANEPKSVDKSRSSLGYSVKMQTMAGEVQLSHKAELVKEGDNWFVEWTPSLLFPQLAEGDKVKVQTLVQERGELIDRNGEGLAVNAERLEVGIVPGRLPEPRDEALRTLAKLLNTDAEAIAAKLKAGWVKPDSFVPITVLSQDDTRLAALKAVQGTAFQTKKVRWYPLGEAAAHLIGYVGKMTAEEWSSRKQQGYTEDDWIGKAGLELVMEDRLRGKPGGRIYIADASGKDKATIARRAAVNGETVKIAVDAGLQTDIYAQIAKDSGAAAALHPLTGQVLALVSSPSYDPNLFISGVSADQWKAWNEDARKPLLNRFARTFAPGSAFKPITGAIALDNGSLNAEQERPIQGKQWRKDASWGQYYIARVSDKTTAVNLLRALQTSDNIYFAQTALELGSERFMSGAAKFGFGEKLPIPYPVEKSTLAVSSIKSDVQLADSGYGQGEVQMSPLHVAVTYTAFANAGNIIAPVLELPAQATGTGQVWKPAVVRPQTAERIAADLVQVIDSPSGTGYEAKIEGITLAGKTGTAELKMSKNTSGKEIGWFVAYDTDKPELLVAMLVEDAQDRGGSHYVAPKIKHIFKSYIR